MPRRSRLSAYGVINAPTMGKLSRSLREATVRAEGGFGTEESVREFGLGPTIAACRHPILGILTGTRFSLLLRSRAAFVQGTANGLRPGADIRS